MAMIVDRRAVIRMMVGGATCSTLLGADLRTSYAEARAAEGDEVAIHWRVAGDQVAGIREALRFEGTVEPDTASTTDTKGLPLYYVLIGTVLIPFLVDALNSIYCKTSSGGLVIQEKGGELIIESSNLVNRCLIIIKGADGVTVKQLDYVPSSSVLLEIMTQLKRK